MISFVLFPYALVLSLYFDILKLFLVMYRAANKFCFLKGAMSDEKCCWTQSRMHYDSFMRILQGRHGTQTTDYIKIFTVKCYFIGMTFHMHPSRFVSLIFIMSNLY